ncbi:hypothetical protein OCGS_0691 [Oceaniovalibus guishaninsula JLT2003]|uniref:Zinc metallopeptidase n=1 Tax=Oceaniovalibus guishaninsula JLT2003 TaxID=1231392 RepID=K2HCT2_9RHOB|nr:neutral zinc metallopeptidase [Oceaniovalibus guishaninsula]EKE45213.1 hypothetical protein OCGS_0691 [Oceaniovalibus guishaninsula JLT2003]
MQWRGRQGSRNIEDRRRGGRGRGGVALGGGGGLAVLAVVAVGWFLGVDLTPLLDDAGPQAQRPIGPADEEAAQFVSVVLRDTERVWSVVFADQLGAEYPAPVLVLFSGATSSACGGASMATGPFYCPADGKVYLDTQFFAVMQRQLGAGGDFAQAYVVAHEVGHHVQNVLGTLSRTEASGARGGDANAVSVRVELQADCYAGIWARHQQDRFGTLDPGDVGEAMNAARQIGDDRLQQQAGRVPRPETFTHGTSAQRQRWFARGYDSGDLRRCDTFGTPAL